MSTVGAEEQPQQAQEEEILLSEQLGRVQTMEDVEALASEEHVEEQKVLPAPRVEKPAATRAKKRVQQQEESRAGDKHDRKPPAKKKKMISLQAVLSRKAQDVQCPSMPVVVEEEVSRTGLSLVPGWVQYREVTLLPSRKVAWTKEG